MSDLEHNYELDCPACLAQKRAAFDADFGAFLNDPDVLKGIAIVVQLSLVVSRSVRDAGQDLDEWGEEMQQWMMMLMAHESVKQARDLLYADLETGQHE
jgi:hypothetical protein